MLIRGPIFSGNVLNNQIAKQLRSGPDAYRSTQSNAIVKNTPSPKDVIVMISEDGRMRYQEGLPSK